jgi:rhamnose utilization protein RhaD (predicted bifunctional aldolase and dehydrogenase)
MNNVDKFLALFSEFDMIVKPKQRTTKPKKEFNVLTSQISQAKSDLQRELVRLTKEYKAARRSFKHNKISRQELFDFEWWTHELQEEIRRIEESDGI